MIRGLARCRRDERGIAMVTVLLVAAAMTAIVSAAVFSTIAEFKTVNDDRKSTAAISYAESGIDRFVQYIRSGTVHWGQLRQAGCEKPGGLSIPKGVVGGTGSFEAVLTVYNPYAATAAERWPLPPNGGACAPGVRPDTPKEPGFYAIAATGTHPAAKRVVLQVVEIQGVGLPIGMSAQSVNANGDHDLTNVTLFTDGVVNGRQKLDFWGVSPYYTLEDFWPGKTWPSGRLATDPMPASVHAVSGIYLKPNASDAEFTPGTKLKNCAANKTGTNATSLWDSDGARGGSPITSGCSGQVGYPPDSLFTNADYARIAPKRGAAAIDAYDRSVLKQAAQEYGLYCFIPTAGIASAQCRRLGSPIAGYSSDTNPILAAGVRNFVAYMEFESGNPFTNQISWGSSVWDGTVPYGCNPNPDLTQSVVIVVENGGFAISGSPKINGAVIADGNFDFGGGGQMNGTIIANNLKLNGGSDFSLNDCWIKNMPGAFLGVKAIHWAEVDR